MSSQLKDLRLTLRDEENKLQVRETYVILIQLRLIFAAWVGGGLIQGWGGGRGGSSIIPLGEPAVRNGCRAKPI